MSEQNLKKYAELLVRTGVNVQKNQTVVISCPVECFSFARLLTEEAYAAGAREVVMNWMDELTSRITLLKAPTDLFDEFPEYKRAFYIELVENGACFINISASDPEVFKGVDPDRMKRQKKSTNTALTPFRERLMANKNSWCVASIPTSAWAKKVFPNDTEETAVSKLWDAILKSVRVDHNDPVAAWDEHKSNLRKKLTHLNDYNFKSLRYKNSLGTDFTVFLADNHIWLGGSEYTPEGVEFIANMPTEEVFTAPAVKSHYGKVVSSMPLNYNGNLIKNFSLTFDNGTIVDFSAEEGEEFLKGLLETDEGARHIGEIALVPHNSPISNLNTLFYNTLYDENASCHFAIGKAYPVNIKDGEKMSSEELKQAGINDSLTHEDFMIGTSDLSIIGTTQDGKEITVFENGNFAF